MPRPYKIPGQPCARNLKQKRDRANGLCCFCPRPARINPDGSYSWCCPRCRELQKARLKARALTLKLAQAAGDLDHALSRVKRIKKPK